jgi:hypothetical protein
METSGDSTGQAMPYVVLWVKPAGSNQTPYCVYTKNLPEGFPEPEASFRKIREPVLIEGIFFKIRTYLATNGKLEECPLILADTVQWQPAVAMDTTARWKPPTWLLMLFFIGMPIVAAWLAISVYRATATTRQAGRKSDVDIADSLRVLAGESNIMTERDRVRQLQDDGPPDD